MGTPSRSSAIARILGTTLPLAAGLASCLIGHDGESRRAPEGPFGTPAGEGLALAVWVKEPGIRLDLDASDPPGTTAFHTPYVYRFPDGTLRMYYDTFGAEPREMRSAASVDGITWTREPGVRLSADDAGSDQFGHANIVEFSGLFRMYYETSSDVESATSTDGLDWTVEPGPRLASARDPFVVPTATGYRMYYRVPGNIHTLESATSVHGLFWNREPGVRISNAREFAVIRLPDGAIVIYYAVGTPAFSEIRSAHSADGYTFVTDPGARLRPGNHPDSDPLESATILTTSILEFPGGLLRMYYQGSASSVINEEARVFSAVARRQIAPRVVPD